MISRRRFSIGAVLALAVTLTSASAIAAGAADFVRAAGARTFESLAVDMTDEQRAARFRKR